MYLSQLMLNGRSRAVQRDLASPYEMHRTLQRGFGNGLARAGEGAERVLYRLEMDGRGQPQVLVQSQGAPEWNALEAGYLAQAAAIKPFAPVLASGRRLAFRLRANPTVRKTFGEGVSKRIGLYSEEEQTAWLARKMEAGGFSLLRVTVSREEMVKGAIVRPQALHELSLLGVQFDGLVLVVDGAAAGATVAHGIGSGKAFGFGLLSLARVA